MHVGSLAARRWTIGGVGGPCITVVTLLDLGHPSASWDETLASQNSRPALLAIGTSRPKRL